MSLLDATINNIAPQSPTVRKAAKARLDQLIMPHWALGRLMDLALDLAGMTQALKPLVAKKTIVTMAGDHGVVAEGVSKFPQEVTLQMVHNFVNGGAGVNVLARLNHAQVIVVDMGVFGDLSALAQTGKIISKRVAPGTQNMAKGPAMSKQQAIQALEAGISVANALAESTDIFGTGDMGIGNTTPSAAIAAVITGHTPLEVTGRGTGVNDVQLAHKIKVIEHSLTVNKPDPENGLDVLAKVGGFEIGGLAGLILGAAAQRKPVVVDGFISTAAALIAHTLCPTVSEYLIASHHSVEAGHKAMLKHLGKEPLLDLNLRLGEGTGAALAMNLAEAAARILSEMPTFAEAAVSQANS